LLWISWSTYWFCPGKLKGASFLNAPEDAGSEYSPKYLHSFELKPQVVAGSLVVMWLLERIGSDTVIER
jgi:hypothetical protein